MVIPRARSAGHSQSDQCHNFMQMNTVRHEIKYAMSWHSESAQPISLTLRRLVDVLIRDILSATLVGQH
jgi:hypothetical protein